jgi:hypothetical protein
MLEKSEVIEEILLCIYGIEKLEGHTTGWSGEILITAYCIN